MGLTFDALVPNLEALVLYGLYFSDTCLKLRVDTCKVSKILIIPKIQGPYMFLISER